MASTGWSAREEVATLASQSIAVDLPGDIQHALKKGDDPKSILRWLSKNREDLSELFEDNKFTEAILASAENGAAVFQKIQVFCCNAFLGTGNVALKAKKTELIDLFYKLAPKLQQKISTSIDSDKLLPPLDEMKIFVGALGNAADNKAISEVCREFLERMRLLPSRKKIGVEARKVRVAALEPNEHNSEDDCAKAKLLAGKAEIISSGELIQSVVIKQSMSQIASSWSHENVSLRLGNLEKVLNFPECSSLRKFQELCQEKGIRFEISESLILSLSNIPDLSFDELLSYLETNPLYQFAAVEIRRLVNAYVYVAKDAATGKQDILSGGSIDFDASASTTSAPNSSEQSVAISSSSEQVYDNPEEKTGSKGDEKKPLLDTESITEDEQDNYSIPDSGEERDPEDEIEGTDSERPEDRSTGFSSDEERPKDEDELTGSSGDEKEVTTGSPRPPLRALERVDLDNGDLWSVVEEEGLNFPLREENIPDNAPPLVPVDVHHIASPPLGSKPLVVVPHTPVVKPPVGSSSVPGKGAINSLVPTATTPTAPALPLGSSKKHLITGRPPLYYALKDVYDLLERPEVFKLEKSECFKYLSIPRMKMYLEKLKEIKGNAALTVAGSVLWDTLNPDKPNFRAEQLLEVLASGKNILEEAIEKHQKPYFEQIKKALTEPAVRKYELAGKCFYIESKDGVIYLMLKDGANPSDEELKEAIREYQVICEDMSNKTDAKAYLLDEPFTRNKANQQKIATIMTRFGMELANDNTVQESNKAVHKAVHEFSKKMKDPISLTAEDKTKDKVTEEARLNYRVMTSEGCLIPEGESAREPERVQYLDTISQWEKKPEWSYLNSVSILNDVLPELDVTTYKKEKVLAQVYPLPMDGKLEHEIKRRATQRELHNKEEMQLQEAIKHSLQTAAAEADDAAWLEQDIAAAKAEAEAFAKTVQIYEGNEEAVVEREEADYARAVQESLKTYLEEHYTIQNVPGDGNCFYRAVEDQLKLQGIHNFNQNNVELHTSLRLLVQGRNFTNGEWAGVHQLFALVKRAKVVIAVMDTRYPYLGFRCYYRDRQGNIAETYDSAELKRQQADQTVIHLAYTGGHYMSVREYKGLDKGAIQGTRNVAEPQSQHQQDVAPALQPGSQLALASKKELFPSSAARPGQGSKRPSLPPQSSNPPVVQSNVVHTPVPSQTATVCLSLEGDHLSNSEHSGQRVEPGNHSSSSERLKQRTVPVLGDHPPILKDSAQHTAHPLNFNFFSKNLSSSRCREKVVMPTNNPRTPVPPGVNKV